MLPIDTCLVSKKFYKSPLTNYDFGVTIGALLLKLQNFKKVKLIFGHPVLTLYMETHGIDNCWPNIESIFAAISLKEWDEQTNLWQCLHAW